MHIDGFRYFIELARVGSFYRAAKNMYISQQGMNKAISSLEAELEVKLVERSRAGVRLTAEGEVFLRRAKRIVAEYDALLDDLVDSRFQSGGADEPITLHVSYYAAQTAAASKAYVGMLAERTTYLEEPYDKLVEHAALSDGNDLSYLDVHAHSLDELLADERVRFEPILKTRYGFVWKEGSSLAGEMMLHRETVAHMPVALNSFREMAQLSDRLFRDHPLENVRLGVASPRMLLEFVHTSEYDAIAGFDSFGFFLSQLDDDMPTDGLRFTPLSTPESVCLVGFLYPRDKRISIRARHSVNVLKRFLAETCAAYYDQYPLG